MKSKLYQLIKLKAHNISPVSKEALEVSLEEWFR